LVCDADGRQQQQQLIVVELVVIQLIVVDLIVVE
jgi:hypothetical protein